MARPTVVTELVLGRALLGRLGPEIGRGGQARVYLLPTFRLPDAPVPLAYKEYLSTSAPPHGLRALVAKRLRLSPSDRGRLDARTCWPLRVVEDGGVVRGIVMPLIPSSYMQERVLLGTKGRKITPRDAQNLFVDPAMMRRLGLQSPNPAQRLMICRDFAAAIHLLHRQDLVFGDINPRNAIYRIPDRPTVMLLDCDAIRIKGSMSVVAQLDAPDWDPPEGGRQLTQNTDRYKFGLFVLRCLGPGKMASINRDPTRADAALDAEGRGLLRAALNTTPDQRTTAQEWGRYFDRRLSGMPSGASPAPPRRTPWFRGPRAGKRQPSSGGRRRDANGVWRPAED